MKKIKKRLSCILSAAAMLTVITGAFPLTAAAKEQTFELNEDVYEFNNEKSEYEIDKSEPSEYIQKDFRLGSLAVKGDIQKDYEKDGIPAYEIADGEIFNLEFTYSCPLKGAGKDSWHLADDSDEKVNGVSLSDDVGYGAVILQTSLDGEKWYANKSFINVSENKTFGENQINDVQLANGCYYRVIVAFQAEIRTKDNKIIDDYDRKRIAQVYEFYASYKNTDTAPMPGTKKFYFPAGAKNATYTVKTKKNNYSGSETINTKDPHYGWDLGSFCLSGYTDNGDEEDVYLKNVGNKVKLTFHLEQNIKKLNGNSDLKISEDKSGSDEEFKVKSHNMKHGELIIRHTDSENVSKEVKYSDFLAALASPGADTAVQLFEEGDYEVHLNYAITNYKGRNSTTYYQTSFKFKIRNGSATVHMFDLSTSGELRSGAITPNGFRIDTANSKYTKLVMTRKVLNNGQTGLTEDTLFNSVVSDGSEFREEGIYTIYASNPNDKKVKDFEATIYVGDDPILAAYTKYLNASKQYTIAELNNMVNDGYTITADGEIIAPVETTTEAETTELTTTTTTTTTTALETTTTTFDSTTTTSSAETESETTESSTATTSQAEGGSRALPIVGGLGAAVVAIGGVGFAKLKKKDQS